MSVLFLNLYMAVIKLSHIVSNVKGSIGGSIFGNTGNQMYIRNKTSPVNKVTSTQGKQRQFITSLTQSWRSLADNQRLLWNIFSKEQTLVNRVGDDINMSGFNWYVSLNSNLHLINKPLIIAPLSSSLSKFIATLGTNLEQPPGFFGILHLPAVPSGYSYVVYATIGLAKGVKPKDNQFRKVFVNGTAGSVLSILAGGYQSVFGQVGAVGSNIFFKIKVVNNSTGFSNTSSVYVGLVI